MNRPGKSEKDRPESQADDEFELADSSYYAHDAEAASASFWTIAWRLPSLIGKALSIAWQASRADTIAAIGLNLFAGVLTAGGLLATTGVLTALLTEGPTPERVRAALPSILLVASAGVARSVLSAAAGLAEARLQPKVREVTARRLYDATTRVELAAFDDPDFQDSLDRARDRGLNAADDLVGNATDVLTAMSGIVAAAGVLAVLHPVLLPLIAVAVVPNSWATIRSARLRYAYFVNMVTRYRRKYIVSSLMAERTTAAELRSFTMRPVLIDRYDRLAAYELRGEVRLARRQAVLRLAADAAGGIGTTGIYVALGLLLLTGSVPLAVAGTAVLAIQSGKGYLSNLLYQVNYCYENGLYFTDFLEFLASTTGRTPSAMGRAPADFETITARNVSFAYPGEDASTLEGIDLEIRAGETIALVGENGSGKTTLAKLLAGLYRPNTGQILWDNTDLATIAPESLAEKVSVIAQDHGRWPLTIRQNVTMSRDWDEQTYHYATSKTNSDEVISSLPNGPETLMDKRFKHGHDLSGGQWQRISAARGLYRTAPLFICDEPTAALDARAEHAIFEVFRTHATGRTVLLITHRLASVKHADRIYVLDHGRIIETGSHSELVALGGTYAELYYLQASAYRADDQRVNDQ